MLLRLLLLLYPASFRAEYGAEIARVFAARRRDTSNPFAILGMWLETIADTITSAIPAHWDILRQDVVYTVRTLRRTPGFTITALLVTALGIGATTAAFTVTDHVLLRALPFPDAGRLVMLWEDQRPRSYATMEASPANYRDWKGRSRSFELMGAWHGLSVNLTGDGEPLRIEGVSVTFDLFHVIGAQPAFGRLFTADDDREGAAGTVVLSDALWKRRYGGDPGVLGRKVVLDSEAYTIIGVMPPTFYFPRRTVEVWTATRFAAQNYQDRADNWLYVLARLRRGATTVSAQAEMNTVAAQLTREWPKENADVGITVEQFGHQIGQNQRYLLMALLGASLCVLLIGCTNLANLLLARAMVRRKEFAVRTAIGAGRERLVRQLMTESLLLSLAGAAGGVAMAWQAAPLLAKLVPNSLPIAEVPSIDWRVLGFALVAATVTGIGFGVVPALRSFSGGAAAGLQEGSRGGVGGRRERLRSMLVVAEVAVSVVLLVSCGLLMRALLRVQAVDSGFRSAGVLTMRTWLPWPKYATTAARVHFYQRVLEEAHALPGVRSAAYASFLPMAMRGGIWPVSVPGYQDRGKMLQASLRFITPEYFDTLQIPLKAGRGITEQDTRQAPFVAVVSESFARQYWPGQNPVGRRFKFAFFDRTVAGIVGNVRVSGLERESLPQVYLPYQQVPDESLIYYPPKDLVVRADGAVGALAPALRRIIAGIDPNQPVSDVRLMDDIVEAETAPRRVQVRVLGAFAVIGFALAAIGIHGLLSFAVSARTQEIGVRLALGAQRSDILGMVAGSGARLALTGAAAGAGLAYAAGRALESLLFGSNPADVVVFGSAVGLSLVMSVAGSLIPAIRAVRVDPAMVIRAE
jgi:predicted permease